MSGWCQSTSHHIRRCPHGRGWRCGRGGSEFAGERVVDDGGIQRFAVSEELVC